MSQTRYCSTCGTLLSEGAAICGECGARYQASPYERRATDAPGAWSQAPKPRSRDLGPRDQEPPEIEGIELISREALQPKEPGATALRTQEQYDQMMVTQPPMNESGSGASFGQPSGPGSPAPAAAHYAPGSAPEMEPPLDGCTPASPLRRFLAALIDGVIATVVLIPLLIGGVLLWTQDPITLLPQILVGVGAALPAAYTVLMIWLSGAKGITLGKLIMGLRITRFSEGGGIGFLRALGRWVLYVIIPPLMALSIFIDPKKVLRGVHDRAIDSAVVDVKAGRNPFHARPDDFERASADHYLGAPSVAVTTHENLLFEPGAAWKDDSRRAADGGADQGAASGAWGEEPQFAASPYAPPAPSGSSAPEAPIGGSPWASPPPAGAQEPPAPVQQPMGGGWAPPPAEPAQQSPPSQRAEQQRGQQSPPSQRAEQRWGQPAPSQAEEQQWGQSAPPQHPEQLRAPQAPAVQQQPWDQTPAPPRGQPTPHQAPQSWEPPLSAPDAPAPQYGEPEQHAYQQPYPEPAVIPQHPQDGSDGRGPGAPSLGPTGAPSELTGDAWGADSDDVDEQTRMSMPEEPMDDIEQTRISVVSAPEVKKLRLTADDGADRVVETSVVIGRNPVAPSDEVLFVLKDDTRSVSKTHLLIDGTGDDITVTDLGSTNGSTILREDGSRESLIPNSPTVLPAAAKVTLGDRTLSVEREQ